MKSFEEYRNFYSPSEEVGEAEQKYIYPAPKTFKEWAQASIYGLDFDLPANLEPKTFMEYALAVQADPDTYAFPTTDIMLAESISGYAIEYTPQVPGGIGVTQKVFSIDGETPANVSELIPNYKYGVLVGSIDGIDDEEELEPFAITVDGYIRLPNIASGEITITSVCARVSKLQPKTPTEIYIPGTLGGYAKLFPQYEMPDTGNSVVIEPTTPGTLDPGGGGGGNMA